MKRVFIFVLLSLLLDVDGKKLKILVNSPNLGYSHLQFQGKIADILVEAGHEVVAFLNQQLLLKDFFLFSTSLFPCGIKTNSEMVLSERIRSSDTIPIKKRGLKTSNGSKISSMSKAIVKWSTSSTVSAIL